MSRRVRSFRSEIEAYGTRKVKQEARNRLRELNDRVKDARRAGMEILAAALGDCRAKRSRAMASVGEAKATLKSAREGLREARSSCELGNVAARRERKERLEQAKTERNRELAEQRRDRITAKWQRKKAVEERARRPRGQRAGERLTEANDQIENDIAPDLIPLWRRLRRNFKGTPHQRVERFHEYLEENPEALERLHENQMGADREFEREAAAHYARLEEEAQSRSSNPHLNRAA